MLMICKNRYNVYCNEWLNEKPNNVGYSQNAQNNRLTEKILCEDGSCIGVLDQRGVCKECGRTPEEVKAEILFASRAPTNSLAAVAPNGKSKLTAALFALLLGGLGIHKFYLGSVGWGIGYLLFCWTFIPAIIGFIEGILLLVMSESDFNKKYGNA
jgi:TM2 domain-containing membrane protein YozV